MRFALAAVMVLLLASPAHAGLKVCNKSIRPAKVALGHFDGIHWTSEGWWTIEPKTCTGLIGEPLDARFYYLYATDGASGTWDGSTHFCTATSGRFSISGRGACAARGYDRKGFFAIDTGQKPDWIQTLSD